VSGRAAGDGRAMYRFSELTPGLPSEFFDGGEIEFFNEGPAPYEIHEITFTTESPPPSVVFSASAAGDLPRFDSRLPTEFREAGVIVDGVATLAARRTDAIEVGYFMDPEAFRSGGSRPRVTLTLVADDGTHRDFVAYLRPGENRLIVRPALWLRRLEAVSLSITEAPTGFSPRVVRRIPTSTDARTPIPSGLTELLMYPREWWRGEAFELFSWSLYPRILWVDSVTYAQQAAMFRRLAFFVEKRGFQGRLLTDEELRGRHGWNAHNYRPEGLAAFYNAVRETDFPINPQERELLRIVLENGILVEETDGSFLPGDGGILAVSQESYDELRRLLIVHEAMHGIFYQEPEFRDAVFAYWDAELNQRERAFWRDFLSWASYEPDDRYLMVNEFQGYLLQQQQAAVRWYFRSRYRERLENAYPDRRESISLFMRDHPSTFVDAGAAMNDALFRIVGMVGGDPFCLAAPPARE
jgi:hypothetical protein